METGHLRSASFPVSMKNMRRFLVRFLLVLAALWLPVQGVQAAAMPLCQHQQSGHETQDVQALAQHHEHHAQQHQHGQGHDSHAKHHAPADNCSNSHGCCSPGLPSFASSVNTSIGAQPQIALAAEQFPTTYLEHPQRPPQPDSV
jgi:hypothetical protein